MPLGQGLLLMIIWGLLLMIIWCLSLLLLVVLSWLCCGAVPALGGLGYVGDRSQGGLG